MSQEAFPVSWMTKTWGQATPWQFTRQTVAKYEAAIHRHGQAVRWIQSILCPRIQAGMNQHDPTCPICNGRGRIYELVQTIQIFQEIGSQETPGQLTVAHAPITGNPLVWHQKQTIPISVTQPSPWNYIAFDPPYPEIWNTLLVDYQFSPLVTVTGENSQVVGTNTLQTIATRQISVGQDYSSTIDSVISVQNVTHPATYTVASTSRDFIFLSGMPGYVSGDTLSVNYTYVIPYNFVITGMNMKMEWLSPYEMENADALLIAPGWAKISSGDLFTPLSAVQNDSQIIDPRQTGPSAMDTVKNVFDIKSISQIILYTGVAANPSDYQLFGRNQINWISNKPTQPYTVQYQFNPTFVALPNIQSLRYAENKVLANRTILKNYNKASQSETPFG